jgi:adenylate cyclase
LDEPYLILMRSGGWMPRNFRAGLIRALSRGGDAFDPEDLQLKRTLLVAGALMVIACGLLWGLLYAVFGEPLAAALPLGYSALSLCSLAVYARTRRFGLFRSSQLLLILIIPFLLMVALGGFLPSSAVILWSFMCPLGALLFSELRAVPRWFLAYAALTVAGAALQPYLRSGNNLPPALVVIFFALNLIAVPAITFALLYYFVGQKNAALALLRVEQRKSESLLLNILPKEIAAILKDDHRTIADHFDAVSVLFADVVNFTPLSAEMPPNEMVDLLNEVFTAFDELVDKYDVEKIRTIGDSYMVASGVPRVRADHAEALAGLALDMSDFIRGWPGRGERRLDFRIGINSGPAVAGVIGRKKFIYDLWGDSVNTASRMESHGTPGKIQITRETYELIKDRFVCEPRGRILVKGKGELETWFLMGAKPPAEATESPLAETLAVN